MKASRGACLNSVFVFFVIFCSPLGIPGANAGFPKIASWEPVYDFGTVANTGRIEHTFVIWNEGDKPLQIGNLRACCGASMKMAEKTISPGTNAQAKVTFSLRGRKGRQRKSFYVASNDPTRPHLQLRLEGTAVAEEGSASSSVDFGQISPDTVIEKEVKVVCRSKSAFSVTGLVSTVTQFSGTCGDSGTNESHVITVRTVPPLPLGVISGKIRVLTDNEECPEIEVGVRAAVASGLIVVPGEILLTEKPGSEKTVTRHVAIRSRSGKPFKILKVQPPQPDIEVTIRSIAPNVWRLSFSNIIPDKNLDGANFRMTTDHPSAKEIAIPLRVVVADEAGGGYPIL